jgi:hypothetical protein
MHKLQVMRKVLPEAFGSSTDSSGCLGSFGNKPNLSRYWDRPMFHRRDASPKIRRQLWDLSEMHPGRTRLSSPVTLCSNLPQTIEEVTILASVLYLNKFYRNKCVYVREGDLHNCVFVPYQILQCLKPYQEYSKRSRQYLRGCNSALHCMGKQLGLSSQRQTSCQSTM